jgi:general stress protein 26
VDGRDRPGHDGVSDGTLYAGVRYRHVDHEDRIWNIIEQSAVGMLTTRFTDGLRARPLKARPDRAGGVIYFIVDVRGLKDDEIEAAPDVCFTVTNAHDKAYLSITARATVLRDPLLAAKLWKKTDDVWWPGGPDDRHVRVLRLAPVRAELWDGPARSEVAACEFRRPTECRRKAQGFHGLAARLSRQAQTIRGVVAGGATTIACFGCSTVADFGLGEGLSFASVASACRRPVGRSGRRRLRAGRAPAGARPKGGRGRAATRADRADAQLLCSGPPRRQCRLPDSRR